MNTFLRRRTGPTVRYLLLAVVAFIALLPTYVMFTGAFKTQADFLRSPFGLPLSPTLAGFGRVWSAQFPTWFSNSVIVTGASVILTIAIAALAAWGFANWNFPGKSTLLAVIISLMVIPPVVLLIPLFQMGAQLGWISTFQLLIVIYIGLMLPFSIFMLTNFFSTVPSSMLEAAKVDGASSWTTFVRIVLPLSKAPMATLAIVNVLWAWNELLLALVLMQSNDKKTLMIGLTGFQSRYSLDIPTVMAGMAIATLPLLVVYLFGQRSFIQGLTAGAIKGE
ncbi:carbohydrate ABC transporter permease [Diaminobutyricibacter tongyongensis]|uniref:Carbohydrate ABC transporter permease n=1 Tax=Leifsonia tongyongensis TaxID=1268043 RepID=A0A6L9XTL2_9MICO|nr:carbohydrate ABC transporter permease [Diaminobutyricibacter tongyongensis]NEN04739.1 carbohydrate ABC transporter permease [Diaminobutyricibacter tongyongensis]